MLLSPMLYSQQHSQYHRFGLGEDIPTPTIADKVTVRRLNVTGVISLLIAAAYLVSMLLHSHLGTLDTVFMLLSGLMVAAIAQALLFALWTGVSFVLWVAGAGRFLPGKPAR